MLVSVTVIWGSKPPRELSEHEWDSPEVKVWCMMNINESLTPFCLMCTLLLVIYMCNSVFSAASWFQAETPHFLQMKCRHVLTTQGPLAGIYDSHKVLHYV